MVVYGNIQQDRVPNDRTEEEMKMCKGKVVAEKYVTLERKNCWWSDALLSSSLDEDGILEDGIQL